MSNVGAIEQTLDQRKRFIRKDFLRNILDSWKRKKFKNICGAQVVVSEKVSVETAAVLETDERILLDLALAKLIG